MPSPFPRRTIAFDTGHLQERGTEVAMYDYAHFAETLLAHRSIILVPALADLSCLDKFRQRFPVYLYHSREDLEELLQPVDLYWTMVFGNRPDPLPPRPPHGKLAAHCVFTAAEPYGDIHATISDWLSRVRGPQDPAAPKVPAVPYMVYLPEVAGDYRAELGIPRDAVVYGRHGGRETFNIPWVKEVVRRALDACRHVHFVFLNTDAFVDHPRVHWLDPTIHLEEKRRFINTCDAMLHARAEGETFGLAVAEFSISNKPVITWSGGHDRFHLEVLGDLAITFDGPQDLAELLLTWRPQPGGQWDAYSERFSPEAVMQTFARVFLGEERALLGAKPVILQPTPAGALTPGSVAVRVR